MLVKNLMKVCDSTDHIRMKSAFLGRGHKIIAPKSFTLQVNEVRSKENWFTNDHSDYKAHRKI